MRRKLPDYGDVRIIRKFLWLPMELGREKRWLERTSWVEEYRSSGDNIGCWRKVGWEDGGGPNVDYLLRVVEIRKAYGHNDSKSLLASRLSQGE